MDPLKPFLEERCRVGGQEKSTSYKDLVDAYKAWCADNSIAKWEVLSKAKLTPALKAAGFEAKLTNEGRIAGWYGLEVL
jgi:hypothetical protein